MHQSKRLLAASAVAAAALSFASAYEGEGTTYGLTNLSGGNCNLMSYPDQAKSNFAAINKAQWDRTMNCGGCARVKCTDAQCVNPSKSSDLVYIVDQCPGCEDGDLDLSPTVFKAITGMEPSRVKIAWEFVTCPVYQNIEYCLKKGSNSYWAAVQPTNMAARVSSVTIDGKPTSMVESAYYFLLDGNSTTMSDLTHLTIRLTSVAGEVVEDVVSFANADCVKGSNQFSSTEAATSSSTPTTQAPTTETPVTTASPTTRPPVTTPPPTTRPPVTSAPPTTRPPVTTPPPTTRPPVTTASPTARPPVTTAPPTTRPPVTTPPPTTSPPVTTASQTTRSSVTNKASGTTAPPTSAPSSDNTSFGGTSESISTQGGADAGPTVVVSVLTMLGCLFAAVVFIVAVVIAKTKKLDKQLEQEKLSAHGDGSRYSSGSDFHANVAIDEQMAYSYAAAVTPQPVSSTSI